MKQLMAVVLLVLVPSTSSGQKPRLICVGDLCSISQTGENGQRVHLIANVFEQEVGDLLKSKLKAGQPSCIDDPKANFWTYSLAGKHYHELRYSVRILPCSPDIASSFFARRGTWLFYSSDDVKQSVEKDADEKYADLLVSTRAFYRKVLGVCVSDASVSALERYYGFLKECFVVASGHK